MCLYFVIFIYIFNNNNKKKILIFIIRKITILDLFFFNLYIVQNRIFTIQKKSQNRVIISLFTNYIYTTTTTKQELENKIKDT